MKPLILCDKNGESVGAATWKEAHEPPGKLHKAFSIYAFRNFGKELLIQKRSTKKPLWAGVWANSCCSHPHKDEKIEDAARRRLQEECGFSCDIKPACTFVYRAEDSSGKGVEHEHVTVFLGLIDEQITVKPNPDEVEDAKWIGVEELRADMKENPKKYAPWFHLGMNAIRESIS